MSGSEMPGQTSLFDLQPPANGAHFGEGPTEKSVRTAIESMKLAAEFDAQQLVLSDVCLALGRNIDAGIVKGRAIANEAAQLASLLKVLAGDDEEVAESSMPDAVRRFSDALESAPRLDTPTASYPA